MPIAYLYGFVKMSTLLFFKLGGIFFFWVVWVLCVFKMLALKLVRMGIFVLILEEMLSALIILYVVICVHIIYGLCCIAVCSFYIHFVESFFFFFTINEYWILSKTLFLSIEMIIWFLFFNLLMWCITLINLWTLNHPCIHGINPNLSCCMILLQRRQWHPTPVLLPGKSHGRRSLVGCSPWGR